MPSTTSKLAMLAALAPVAAVPAGAEWAGIFAVSDATHTWSMQKVGCDYADPAMKVVYIPVTDCTEAGMEAVEDKAATLLAGTCTVVEAGGTITPAAAGSCVDQHVGNTDDTEYTVTTAGITCLAIFAQHVPIEFERDRHYFYDSKKVDIEPIAQEGGGGHGHGHDHGRRLSEDPHAGHDHGGGSEVYEWAGVFAVADKTHKWIMQKVGGAYADPAMKLVLIPSAADASEVDIHKAAAETLMAGTCTVVEAGGTITKPPAGGACYDLHVACNKDDSIFTMATDGLTGLTVFAQHVPIEFERDMHFFKDSADADIEKVAFTKRWGEAIAASLIVNLITLSGVILMVPVLAKSLAADPMAFDAVTNAFAAGALIACAFFLMFPEGYLYVAVGSPGEGNTAFLFGLMVLLGVITASIFDLIVSIVKGATGGSSTKADVEGGEVDGYNSQTRVLSSVLIGDFAHNFFDGTFIGIAFTGCSNTMAWGITVATVLHEIAQEIADFIVLTDPKQGKLKAPLALVLNFVSGLSVMLGVVIVMSMDLGPRTVGCGLVFGGGIYIQIGLAECMGRVYAQALTVKLKIASIVLFSLGALAIGAVLFGHEHCVPEGDDSHEGHDHGRRLLGLIGHAF